jgi:hypothetical protein
VFYTFPICSYCRGAGCFVCDGSGVVPTDALVDEVAVICLNGHFYTPDSDPPATSELDDKGRCKITATECLICAALSASE